MVVVDGCITPSYLDGCITPSVPEVNPVFGHHRPHLYKEKASVFDQHAGKKNNFAGLLLKMDLGDHL